jgi:demethylmenaquinone methyltransferase/2-methoxy-6-polyprenyl-1,4-benzoquinol methylase
VPPLFDTIAPRYELVNHMLTGCLDVLWRRIAARMAAAGGGDRWLDVCAGTGEMASALRRAGGPGPRIIATDLSLPMLQTGERRCRAGAILPATADSAHLPFPDETFDLVTISFASRNVNLRPGALAECFREFHRVLRPGGRFVNLETSQPPASPVRWVLHAYARRAIEPLAGFVAPAPGGYTYLARTIPTFPGPEELAQLLRECGFSQVIFRRLTLGVVAVHLAVR